ncbi:MAG: hypothetical protein RLZZ458_986, partial [Planctomycetota bacterium]
GGVVQINKNSMGISSHRHDLNSVQVNKVSRQHTVRLRARPQIELHRRPAKFRNSRPLPQTRRTRDSPMIDGRRRTGKGPEGKTRLFWSVRSRSGYLQYVPMTVALMNTVVVQTVLCGVFRRHCKVERHAHNGRCVSVPVRLERTFPAAGMQFWNLVIPVVLP